LVEFVVNYIFWVLLGWMVGLDDFKGLVVFFVFVVLGYVIGVNLFVDGGWIVC